MEDSFWRRLLSRKFLVAVGSFIVGLTGVIKPESAEKVELIAAQIAEAVLLIAPVIWLLIEGKVDITRASKKTE